MPLPEWGCERPEYHFSSEEHYQRFYNLVSHHLEQNITEHCYDTLSNFLTFAHEYMEAREEYPSMAEFFRDYDPPVLQNRYTCVGLSADLVSRLAALEDCYPGIKDAMYQVSCEEEVEYVEAYCSVPQPPVNTCEKEHVLVCVRFHIGDRPGLMLLDPGYHVAQPVTVMEDRMAPHSPPIVASTRGRSHKTYEYSLSDNGAFVVWKVEESKAIGILPHRVHQSLIHVSRPYLSTVDVAERRNLVYLFKTLLARNCFGHLTAGVYFPIRPVDQVNITLFYQEDPEKETTCDTKIPLSYFLDTTSDKWTTKSTWETTLKHVAKGLCWPVEELQSALHLTAKLLNDHQFYQELYNLNEAVDSISCEN